MNLALAWFMKLTLAGLLLAAALAPAAAQAAPRAESAQECSVAADMAVVARSLADEGIQPPKATAIMERIYDVRESTRGRQILKDILDTASSRTNGETGVTFAEELFATCIKESGNMDHVLGRRL